MLKKLFLFILIAAPLSVFAQDKFAYVNAQEVFGKMPELSEVESKLATERETMQKNSTAIQNEYTALLKKYQELPEDAAASVRADLEKQLQQVQERYQQFVESSQTEMQKKQEALVTPINQKLMQAIKDVGDENSYTYIFDRAAMHYVSPNAIDATKQVKTKLGIKD